MTPAYPSPFAPQPDVDSISKAVDEAEYNLTDVLTACYGFADACITNGLLAAGAVSGALEKEAKRIATKAIKQQERVITIVSKAATGLVQDAIDKQSSVMQLAPSLGSCVDKDGNPLHITCEYGKDFFDCCVEAGYDPELCKNCFGPPPPPPPPEDCEPWCTSTGEQFEVCTIGDKKICVEEKTHKQIDCPPDGKPGQCKQSDNPPPPPPPGGCPECCPPSPINVINNITVEPCKPIVKIVTCDDDDDKDKDKCPPLIDPCDPCPIDPRLQCTVFACAPEPQGRQIQYFAKIPFSPSTDFFHYPDSECGEQLIQETMKYFLPAELLIMGTGGYPPGALHSMRLPRLGGVFDD